MVLKNTPGSKMAVGLALALLAAATALGGCRSVNKPHQTVTSQPQAYEEAPWLRVQPGEDRATTTEGRPDDTRHVSPHGIELGPEATLDDYRLYAALNNRALHALYYSWRAARERGMQAIAPPEPSFRYTEFLEEVETRVGPQERKYALTLFIPWIEKLSLRAEIADEGAKAAWQRLQAEHLVIDTQLTVAYAEYYFLGRQISITRDNLDLLQRLETVARRSLAVGDENYADVFQLQTEIGRLEERVSSLTDMLNPYAARLNAILNRPTETELPVPTALPEYTSGTDRVDVVRQLETYNPELLALEREVEGAAIGKKLAARSYYPDFSFGVETIGTGSAVPPNTPGSGNDPWMVMLGVELPVWYGKYRAEEREAEARWLSARDLLSDRRNRLRAALELALYNRRDAERKISLYRDTLIPKAREWLRTAETALRVATKDYDDLIAAQRALLEFQLLAVRARVDRLKASAEIDRNLGRFVVNETRASRPKEARK